MSPWGYWGVYKFVKWNVEAKNIIWDMVTNVSPTVDWLPLIDNYLGDGRSSIHVMVVLPICTRSRICSVIQYSAVCDVREINLPIIYIAHKTWRHVRRGIRSRCREQPHVVPRWLGGLIIQERCTSDPEWRTGRHWGYCGILSES